MSHKLCPRRFLVCVVCTYGRFRDDTILFQVCFRRNICIYVIGEMTNWKIKRISCKRKWVRFAEKKTFCRLNRFVFSKRNIPFFSVDGWIEKRVKSFLYEKIYHLVEIFISLRFRVQIFHECLMNLTTFASLRKKKQKTMQSMNCSTNVAFFPFFVILFFRTRVCLFLFWKRWIS